MTQHTLTIVLRGLDGPTRLDRALRDRYPQWGRKAVQSLISGRKVKVNGKPVWLCSWEVYSGDRVEVSEAPPAKPAPPQAFDDAWLIADAGDLIAVDKPAGLLSHASRGERGGDLLSLARARFGSVSLFHRLDRDTSGVVLLTRGGPVNKYLDAAFKAGTVEKEYLALVEAGDWLPSSGVIDSYIGPHPDRRDLMAVVEHGGKQAITHYEVIGKAGGQRLLRLWPKTGRTHQLRVHLAHLGAPVAGDRLYGEWAEGERLMLHAAVITLPRMGNFAARTFEAPVPDVFAGLV